MHGGETCEIRGRGRRWLFLAFAGRLRVVVMALVTLGGAFLSLSSAPAWEKAAPKTPAKAAPQVDAGTGTAEELLNQGLAAYNAARWAEAEAAFGRFVSSYGDSPEAVQSLPRLLPMLAMSRVRLGKFDAASGDIDRFFEIEKNPTGNTAEELTFWKAVCSLKAGSSGKAIKELHAFLDAYPRSQKREEAVLLLGTTFAMDAKHAEAAEFLGTSSPTLSPAGQGRAAVLRLYSLIQGQRLDEAYALVVDAFPNVGDILQIVGFQTLTLELGSLFLENGDYRRAISCFQRVWPQDRLIRHQEERLKELEARLAAAKERGTDSYLQMNLAPMIANVKRELQSFRETKSFDSAVRLRMASAYQGMQRYRESALIMEAMLNEMPPDPVVESASVNLVQCWSQIERWPKAIEAAKTFVDKFPHSESVPLVLYLEGIAKQKCPDYAAAIASFEGIVRKHAKSDYAPRAQFMKGFTLLLAERNTEAIAAFGEFATKYPKHDMADASAYWRGTAYSMDKQFSECRKAMDEYLAKYKKGQYRASAAFRRAYCAQQARNFPTSIKELSKFLRDYPDAEERSEARILLADALMNEGRIDDGIAALKGIPKEDARFYTEAAFKIGKAYKLLEEYGKLRKHMAQFKANNRRDPRVAEAIYWIGWTHKQAGEMDKARDAYWQAIREYGPDPAIRSVEDLFPALAKLYGGEEEQVQYAARLRDLRKEADASDQRTLAMRALWAQAIALKKSDPAQSQANLVDAASRVNVQTANPLLLADFADALLAAGKKAEAEQMFRDLVKWNPRAPQKDRALAALGAIELERGNEKAALAHFDRFERETVGSRLFGQVTLDKAELLKQRGRNAEARETLEKLLAYEYSSGLEKARALYLIGDMYMTEGKPALALPYYQRIYVMHGRWRDWVARAYLRSGEAFEQLEDALSARRTYMEMTDLEDLSHFQETAKARERLDALGGPLPKEEPSPEQG